MHSLPVWFYFTWPHLFYSKSVFAWDLLYFCSLCLRNSTISFLHKAIVHKPVFIPVSNKDANTHAYVYAYVHSWSPNNGDRNQQNNQLLGPFLCNMCFYWLTIPFIGITFFYWQVCFRQIKANNKITILITHFFYNTILYWLTNLTIGITLL